jgi:hypothetical protein
MALSRTSSLRDFLSLLPYGFGFFGLGGSFGSLVWYLSTARGLPLVLFSVMGGSLVLLLAGRALRPPPQPPFFLTLLSPLQFAPVFLAFSIARCVLDGTPVSLAPVVATIAVAAFAFFLVRFLEPHGLSYAAWRRAAE